MHNHAHRKHPHEHPHGHHGHHHGHHHRAHHAAPHAVTSLFLLGAALNTAYAIAEGIMGWRLNSVSLLADAGHNVSDVLGLLIAWGGARLALAPPTPRHSYGLRSSTILAALANAVLLLIAVGAIAWEAIGRFRLPQVTSGGDVALVALIGIAVNGVTAWLFHDGRDEDLNVRGAYLHMMADAAVSAGVVAGGLLVRATGWTWVDPFVSLVIVVVIGLSTWSLLRDSVNLALHGTPQHIDPDEVRQFLSELPGVTAVHDLHVWGMSTTEAALTAHVVRPHHHDDDAFLVESCEALQVEFGIAHTTLQVERNPKSPCRQAPANAV